MSLILNYNHARLVGTVSRVERQRITVSCKRLSEKEDNVVVCLPGRAEIVGYEVGDRVVVEGRLRSRRVRTKENPNKLEIFVEAGGDMYV